MEIYYFEFEDIDGNNIKLEINLDILRVRLFATTHNFKGEIISKNKIVGWWSAKNKKKLFNILKNNVGYMNYKTIEEYNKFIINLKKKVEE